MKKIREQSAFIREFEGIYELQEEELLIMKEECLAERIAITKIKASGNKSSTNESIRVYEENEFAVSHQLKEVKVTDPNTINNT